MNMENNANPDRRIFLRLADLTDTTVEFGGLSTYAIDHVDIVMHTYRRRIEESTNNNLPQETSEIITDAE